MSFVNQKNKFFATPKDDPRDLLTVEIGDSKKAAFFPQSKISRWSDEVNISLRLKHTEASPTVSQVGDKIIWKGRKTEAHFYDLPISDDHPEGAHELEIVLNEKPAKNVIEFSLVDKGVEYIYQPALTQAEIDEGASRPDNVVGSYVVYATDPKINYESGKLYKTGKVCHIYRPKIIDANGVETWGALNIQGGTLTVTIPQAFLDAAVYPVRHAAGLTIGYTTAGASAFTFNGNLTSAAAVISGQYTGITGDAITSFTGSFARPSSNATVSFAAYTMVSGNPDTRVAARVNATITHATQTWESTSTISQSLTNGTVYCVAISGEDSSSNTFSIYFDAGSPPGRFNSSLQTLGATFAVTGTDSGRHYSWYATYTAAASFKPSWANQATRTIGGSF